MMIIMMMNSNQLWLRFPLDCEVSLSHFGAKSRELHHLVKRVDTYWQITLGVCDFVA